jgi:hypothetical protein
VSFGVGVGNPLFVDLTDKSMSFWQSDNRLLDTPDLRSAWYAKEVLHADGLDV